METVFEQTLESGTFHKIEEKLQEDENFVIDETNVQEFFDCEYAIQILKENNIKYLVRIDDNWRGITFKRKSYYATVKILVGAEDYEKVKQYFEPENIQEDLTEDTAEPYHKLHYLSNRIFDIFLILFGILFISMGIYLIFEISSIRENHLSLFLVIIGITFGFSGIKRIVKSTSNKSSKK